MEKRHACVLATLVMSDSLYYRYIKLAETHSTILRGATSHDYARKLFFKPTALNGMT